MCLLQSLQAMSFLTQVWRRAHVVASQQRAWKNGLRLAATTAKSRQHNSRKDETTRQRRENRTRDSDLDNGRQYPRSRSHHLMPVVLRAAAGSFNGAMHILRESGRALNAKSILLLLEYITLSDREKHWQTLDAVDEKALLWLVERLRGVYRVWTTGRLSTDFDEGEQMLLTLDDHAKCVRVTNDAQRFAKRVGLSRISDAIRELHGEIDITIAAAIGPMDGIPHPLILNLLKELQNSNRGCPKSLNALVTRVAAGGAAKNAVPDSRVLRRLERMAYDPDFVDPSDLATNAKSVSERLLGSGSWSVNHYVTLLNLTESADAERLEEVSRLALRCFLQTSGLNTGENDGSATRRSRQLQQISIESLVASSKVITSCLSPEESKRVLDVITHCVTARMQTIREGEQDAQNTSDLHTTFGEFLSAKDIFDCVMCFCERNQRSPKLFNLVYQGHKDITHLQLRNYSTSQLVEIVNCFTRMNHQHKKLLRDVDVQLSGRLSIPFESSRESLASEDFVNLIRNYCIQRVFPQSMIKELFQAIANHSGGPFTLLSRTFDDDDIVKLHSLLRRFDRPPSTFVNLLERYMKRKGIPMDRDNTASDNLLNSLQDLDSHRSQA
eukprot:gb/GECG01004873.1/.p1 GENE.gb/GECG01004873.1/~~gb/GECG01004873.1/.p1  ORF type:complete len:612 (+),score=58.32 gb/GECG01004873.1/:1-1836(+)